MAELKKAKVQTGGNTKPDRVWLDEVADELFVPDETGRPAGFLYDVHYQWEYSIEDLNLDFFESFRRNPNGRRCNGTAYIRDESGMYVIDCDWQRLTRPCLSSPGRGTTVCHVHGSKIPQVKAAAERALAEASEVVALRLIGLTAPTDEVHEKIEHKNRISAANSVLDRVGIKGGVDVEVTLPGYKKVLQRMFQEEDEEPTDG